ncbi:MAG: CtsR family transcriptional regulator [Oscillospiraceae bacterium]|nr:CtsR family transcriptional regulator [Oscillospiraceae bacterium]MDD7292921.1 CtsR family transcriptional regulator [Clostridiaceae bacterium]MDY5991634.1 CtsR family transcriptional regulator [Oscillospiraceae bacterium]
MNLSNAIAQMISEMLDGKDEVEFRRNTLAQNLGCVPSQINYVISSRFTPERGYIVESRRGGGGFIRIAKVNCNGETLLMHVVNSVGDSIDEATCRAHLANLVYRELLSKRDAKLILSAVSDSCLKAVDAETRDKVRALIFKQLLITVMNN